MIIKIHLLFALVLSLSIGMNDLAQKTTEQKWGKSIEEFCKAEKESSVPKNPIICVGSSSMVMWKNMKRDLAPLPVVNRGFGGSTLPEAFYYIEELAIKHNPAVVMVYEGDNDIFSVEPNYFRMLFEAFEKHLRSRLPDTRIVFLSIKPSIARLHIWEKAQKANALIKEYTETKEYLSYIDITETLYGDDGKLDPDLFYEKEYKNKLHLNQKGYLRWAAVVKPVLKKEYKKAMAVRNSAAESTD